MSSKGIKKSIGVTKAHAFVSAIAGDDFHAKRVLSLANGVVGVIHSAALAVAAIGRGLAQAQGLNSKHTIKQVDRLLSNSGIDLWQWFSRWVPYVVGVREAIVVAMDWTEFDADDHSTLVISMVTRHGRSTPLLWRTVTKSSIKGHRSAIEQNLLTRLSEVVPDGVDITVLADRGFGSVDTYAHHWGLNLGHVIRFRGEITVTDQAGISRPAREWLFPNGRARVLRQVKITAAMVPVEAVVCVWAKGMKEPWFLACGGAVAKKSASDLVKLYSKRFTIEENFRDIKDLRFGMGLSSARVNSPERRDRLLLLSALAITLLTLLGAASEALGYDRLLRANTVKYRTHSLFNQGVFFYGAIPNMKTPKLRALVEKFGEILLEVGACADIFGLV